MFVQSSATSGTTSLINTTSHDENNLLTKKQKQKGVIFCKKYLNWDLKRWEHVLWTDEATFTVTGSQGGKVWMRPGTDPYLLKYMQATVKHPDSVVVWGAFRYHGTGKLVVLLWNITMNKDRYMERLTKHLQECFDCCWSRCSNSCTCPHGKIDKRLV